MSGKIRSVNVTDPEARSVLGPTGNKARLAAVAGKPASKPLRKKDIAEPRVKDGQMASALVPDSPPLSPAMSVPAVLRRQELLLRTNFSLNASYSSDASTDSFCSRASTGRIGRPNFLSRRRQGAPKPEQIAAKLEKIVPDGALVTAVENLQGKKRCAWVTLNSDPGYVVFHDEEWGVPVHDDRRLFELLVLSGALAELTWPVILSKRHIFREVFMGFDPSLVSKINVKKLIGIGSSACTILSEPKLRGVVENANLILKITEEFGSFDKYCWSFVNYKPITSRFCYPRQIPVKTPKADLMSKDFVKRGFRSVGPTVIYSFMQTAGMTNDHLISCYRFEECCAVATPQPQVSASCISGDGSAMKGNDNNIEEKGVVLDVALDLGDIGLDLAAAVGGVSVS